MPQQEPQNARIYIHSLGHYHPPEELPNKFFDRLDIDSDSKWIEDRTGISCRRSVLNADDIVRLKNGEVTLGSLRQAGRVPSIPDIAEPAWKLLCERNPDGNPQVDAVICGTSVPDFDIPSNACSIAARLNLKAFAADTNSACSSFVVDLHFARGLIISRLYRNIAIFNPERYSLRMDFNDRASCVLFGDGCSSALVSHEPSEGSLEVLDTYVDSDPLGYDLVKIPDGEHFSQNGKAVQKFAISRTLEATRTILERNQINASDIQYFTGHQANLRMIMSAAERLGLDATKHLYNVDQFGNQGAAGAPSVISMNWDVFKPGDLIVMTVVGSGLTWGSALLRKT